jgi:uncharacterized protein YgiB involved in biofilm formation
MKHSKQVPLILLGAVTALTGCGKSNDLPATAKQDTYANADDCRKDWGNGNWCNSAPSSHGGSTVYTGPRYYWDRDAGRAMVIENGEARPAANGDASRGGPSHATGTESVAVTRGGFGGTAHGGEGSGHGGGGGGESGGG